MTAFAEFEFVPGGAIACLVVGVVAGLLAGVLVRDGGPGVLADVGVGLLGAAVAGLLFALFVSETTDSLGAVLAAFSGAGVLIAFRLRPCCRSKRRTNRGETSC